MPLVAAPGAQQRLHLVEQLSRIDWFYFNGLLIPAQIVVGLIPVSDAKDDRGRARLVFPPPLGGTYERVSDRASE